MSGRATGEIVADLRVKANRWPRWFETCDEAADRLTELDAEMSTMHRTVVHECCEQVVALDALRPPCPACGGKRIVRNLTTYEVVVHDRCPDCVDGKVSIEQLAATWRAVHGRPVVDGLRSHSAGSLLDHLRAVRP